MKLPARFLLSAAIASAPLVLSCQGPALGPEFQINSETSGAERFPALASLGNGGFVVVWEAAAEDGSGYGVFGQRFDSSGAKAGAEFPVNTYTTSDQRLPAVASPGDGTFVVTWGSVDQDGSHSGVFGQRFDGSGSKVGSEIPINTFTTDDQRVPAVAAAADGSFVVVWESGPQGIDVGEDGDGFGIFGQRFDSSGVKAGSEFQVNTYTTGNQYGPSVATNPSGGFVVVWSSGGEDGSSLGIFGQRFDASGTKVGEEFPVNTYTTGLQFLPSVATDRAGGFVVVWASAGEDGSSFGVFGQRFNGGAEKVGSEFPVNTYTTDKQTMPSATFDPQGRFVVVWASYAQDGSSYGVFGRQFDRDGTAITGGFPVNSYTTSGQSLPRVATDGSHLVVAWNSFGQDGSDYGIFGRRQNGVPRRLEVDPRSATGTDSDANGVLEPGETVLIEPFWSNDGGENFADVTGLAGFTGPGGATYNIPDGSSDYGPMPPHSIASCDDGTPDACYRVMVAGSRPSLHWDANFQEIMSLGGGESWKVHIGDSFADVPRSQPFYPKIETLLHYGITSGCNATQYCPDEAVSRGAMAIFIAKGIAGSGPLVPTAGTLSGSGYNCAPGGTSLFSDVLPTDSFCKHVHYLAAENVTLGCGNGQFCPGETITRDAMASFIAKAIVAPKGGAGVPLTYGPDPGTGLSYSCNPASPNIHFVDVGVSSPFCKHIHFLWAKGIVSGCAANQYCPALNVNRDAMAKFIANGFGLALYGP
jgi:S-layer homology domain